MATNPGSWRLAQPYADRTQGLIISPFAHLEVGVALLLNTEAAGGGVWLQRLLTAQSSDDDPLRITNAARKDVDGDGNPYGGAAIAFTAAGLRQIGLGEQVLGGFAAPFTEGMQTASRRARLADDEMLPPGRRGVALWGGSGDKTMCEIQVHVALMLYHETDDKLAQFTDFVLGRLHGTGVRVAHRLSLSLRFDNAVDPPVARENFGFADGISQPVPFGDGIVTYGGDAYPQNELHGVAAGDVVLGHVNADNEVAPGPTVPASDPCAACLPADPQGAAGQLSLGMDGSYLVMRELSQDADKFWASMQKAAAQIGAPDADWVATRVIGRSKQGVVLAKDPPAPVDGAPGNDFRFWADDSDGMQCPLGSHIRRANPRDGLAPDRASTDTLLKAANNHRILRRGRKYDAYDVPGAASLPGLLFMCLNTDIERQFEFVQRTWMFNCSFAALFNERDPLVAPASRFTIPDVPLRKRPDIDTFVQFIGGDYFFLPSLPAITYLSALTAGTGGAA
jgi:deferrochelatase/peroxidase EfeB